MRVFICSIIAAFILLAQAPAFADCVSTYYVTQTSALNWGAWQIPSGSATATISPTGGVSGSGTQLYGAEVEGEYRVRKNGDNDSCNPDTVTFSILSADCNAPGCTLSNFRGKWNGGSEQSFPFSSGSLPSNNGRNLQIGATATYDGTVPPGAKAPTFTIGIRYENDSNATFLQTGAITFDSVLSVTTENNINFGVVKALTSGTFTIDTDGVVTVSGSGVRLGNASAAGTVKVMGSALSTITISTGSYVRGGVGNGVTLSRATCSYDGGPEMDCDDGLDLQTAPSATGKILKVGVRAVVNNNQPAGTTATPSFTITITYT